MALMFVGTSSDRAPLLAALGWTNLAATTDIAVARRHACIAAIEDACDAVVMVAEVPGEVAGDGILAIDVAPGNITPVEVVDGDTPEERLGFSEKAGVGDIVTTLLDILDKTHGAIRSTLDVGKGGDAELPHLSDLQRALHDAKNRTGNNKHAKRLTNGVNKRLRRIQRDVNQHVNRLKKSSGTPNKKARTTKQNDERLKRNVQKRLTAPKIQKFGDKPEQNKDQFGTSQTKTRRTTKKPTSNTSGPPKGVDAGDWWKSLTRQQQAQYVKDHPESLKRVGGGK